MQFGLYYKLYFRDLVPLNYNIDIKYINNYKDFLDEIFDVNYISNKIA